MARIAHNWIIDSSAGSELITIENGVVTACDHSKGIGWKLLGMTKGAVKAILKRRFNNRRWLRSVAFIQQGGVNYVKASK